MSSPKKTLALLSRSARGGLITVAQVAEVLDVSHATATRKLAELTRVGWLERVRRGMYFIKPMEALPSRPTAAEDPWVIASIFYDPSYIGGWSAAEYWDLTEQIFRSTFVVTSRHIRQRSEKVLGLDFHLVRVGAAEKVTNTMFVWRETEKVRVSSLERTLVDGLNAPGWLGGWRHLVQIISTYRDSSARNLDALVSQLLKNGTGVAFKRIGFLAECIWPDEQQLIQVSLTKRTQGINKLDPNSRSRGKLNKRWGLWVNAGVEVE